MQSVDHYSLPIATDSERLLADIPPGDDPLTEIASADELQPTITEVDGPIPRFIAIDQSMVQDKRDSQEMSFLIPTEQADTSRQMSGEESFANGTTSPLTLPLSISTPTKRNEHKKAGLKHPPVSPPRKQDPGPLLLPPLSRPPTTGLPGLPFYQDQTYPSLVQMPHLPDPQAPSTLPMHSQTNPLFLQYHIPPGGYQMTRPLLEDPASFGHCPCYLTHSFMPHSAPPYQQVYVPIQPGTAPYASLSTSQESQLLPELYTAPRQTLIPAQPYPNMEHIFPYNPTYPRHSLYIPYAIEEALTHVQPPTSILEKTKTTRGQSKRDQSRKRELESAHKLGEDNPSVSHIKRSKMEPAPQPALPGDLLPQQVPHNITSAPPYYRTDNMVPYITTNVNSYYPQYLPAPGSAYPQPPFPYYQHQPEPEKRQQSRRALFQFQGAPPSEDSLGVQPLDKTPQKKMSPTSTSNVTSSDVECSSKNSDHPCGIVQQNSGNSTLLRQNRSNIPPPISVPPHINNFVISDTN